MRDHMRLYGKLPVPLQQIACSLEGARIRRQRYGGAFASLLREAEGRTFWSPEKTRAYRDRRLRAIVQHCADTVPFYQECFKEAGISPNDIHTLTDLQHLPILTKEEVKENYHSLISRAVPERQQVIAHTGGTTGSALHFAITRSANQENWAIVWRFRRWHGIEFDAWCGHFGSRLVVPLTQTHPPYWRYNYPGKQILFSGSHMSPTNLRAYVEELRLRRPPYLHGYPSLLSLLAAHILETGASLGYEVKWVTTGSENLLPQQADLIERAIGVRPRQRYGMAEMVAAASECEYGKLHVDEDFAAVEFIPNAAGPEHRVVGTAFANLAVPLLRYDVGDLVTPATDTCPCGRPGRALVTVDGRQDDYVIMKNGVRLGRVGRIFHGARGIREAQIRQERPGEIIIHVVPGKTYTDVDEVALLGEAQRYLGDETDVLIRYVESLERTRSGKLRLVVSQIPEARLESPRF